ncbi:cobaltochelatase subunit CobN [Methyloversatilis thermotolerans]|uniref:cobaltochelatase subunit CobN n=1 Tax=Methyloversatilis thermotolerans TaxID=1346290 RepID=UPI0004763026|nr:cobaltochelatase subunit CobN [Methyloversatilis thermotolerans]
MCLNRLLLLFLACCVNVAWGARSTVSLVLGDLDSRTALTAIDMLKRDAALRDIDYAVYPSTDLASADLAKLRASRVVFVLTMGRSLATQLGPDLSAQARRGQRAYAVGSTWDDDFRNFGLIKDDVLREYMFAGGPENVANMVRHALARDLKLGRMPAPPRPMPAMAYLDPRTGTVTESHDEFRRLHPGIEGAPWVGILFYRSNAMSGQLETVRAIVRALEKRGLNAMPVFGFPDGEAIQRFYIDESGQARIRALIALGLKIGSTPDKTIPVLSRLDVPVINAITLHNQTREQWESSPVGLDIMERGWQIAAAEFGGAVSPTVVATKEKDRDPLTGLESVVEMPVPERVERVAERALRWVELRTSPPPAKKVAVLYYNYPPGKENIGASYLNVLPRSLWQILARLRQEGYWAKGAPDSEQQLFDAIRDHGANIGNWAPGAIEALARSGRAVLWPVSEYRKHFDRLPPALRKAMEEAWGRPENSTVSIWRDKQGTPYFIFPAQRWGNVLFAPQPARGWEQDVKKLYHDVTVPPHHQYLAFYLWLQKEVNVSAMVHVGTHATHEWHSGKEVGYTAGDPGELFVGPVPQLYPYIVDDIGEGLQAKRRGMATLVSHMTPPLDKAGLNPDLSELMGLISDYGVAREKGALAPAAILADIASRASRMGLLRDLDIAEVDDHAVEEIEHYLKDIGEKRSPFGMHTFGVAPAPERRRSTADAILSVESGLSDELRAVRMTELEQALLDSGRSELDALMAGLAGRYVKAGPGNDPIRNPDSLPTGRNLYGFDPSRLPTPATYATGAKLAEELVASWKKRHGSGPTRLVFNLWGVESSRHEGIMEAQIMALWGVKPVWDGRGRVTAVAAIPREELGRPRVDVTVIPSGLYRDLFSPLIKFLDDAATAARNSPEADNPMRRHFETAKALLLAKGLAEDEAEKLAGVRLFSVPSGAYGTNLDKVVPLSNTWDSEQQVADVYFMRMSHPFGQGMWGGRTIKDGKVVAELPRTLGVDLLKMALTGVQGAVHSRSSNIYATLDNDDFYQYLGGTAMAVRQVNGSTPEVLVTNMANPRDIRTETLEKYMGREMRARYLNPAWIDAMFKEGYAGARFVNRVVEHLWGWTVTTPDRIDDAKWQEMYETYVADKHGLGIRDKFRQSDNMLAFQGMVDRMLTAVNKGYWKASPETVDALRKANMEAIAEAGVACYRDTCSSPEIVELARQQDRALAQRGAPAAATAAATAQRASPAGPVARDGQPSSAADANAAARPVEAARPQALEGFQMEEVKREKAPVLQPKQTLWLAISLLCVAALGGYLRSRGRAAAA